MWKGGSQNSDSYWDNIQNNLYDMFFYEADNIQQIYRDQGLPVPEYQTHDNSYSYGNKDGSSTYLGEYSGGHTSDEALARHLQEMEDGFQNFSFDEPFKTGTRGVSQGGYSFSGEDGVQDDFIPDEMSYEQISELGQSIGNVKKGLSEEQMSRLPTHKYKGSSKKKGKSADDDSECVICKMQYDKGEVLMTLPCAHKYHEDCIKTWLKEDKSCCICKEEVAV